MEIKGVSQVGRLTSLETDSDLDFGGTNYLAVGRGATDDVAPLNPDTEPAPGWREPSVAEFDTHPGAAVGASPLLDGEGYIAEAGQTIYADGATEPIGGRQLRMMQGHKP